MSLRLNTDLGYYTPAFFHIKVNTNTLMGSFSDKDFSVFLHEYIHFLQDVTTIYGLNNMYVYSEYIRYSTNKIYSSQNKQIKVPILPNPSNEGNVYLNKLINDLTFGDSFTIPKIKDITKIKIISDPITISKSPIKEIKSVLLTIIDEKDNEYPAVFGALSIMENMAYLMEQFICPDYSYSSDFPYSIAVKLVEKIYPEFAKDKLNILAICDLSLLFSNPGKVFIEFLNEIVSQKWLPQTPEEIYDKFYLKGTSMNGTGERSIEENFKEISTTVTKQLQGYFNDAIFNDLKIWIEQLVDTSYQLRFVDKYFILNIAKGGNIKQNKVLRNLIENKIGTPLISNRIGEMTLMYPNKPEGIQIGYFLAIGEIVSIFETGDTLCKMKTLCIKEKNKVDYRCDKCPWEHTKDDLLCPFAFLWKHWNLKDCTILK